MIAGVVGTLLLAINQGDVLLGAEWPGALLWKAALTYLVPVGLSSCAHLGRPPRLYSTPFSRRRCTGPGSTSARDKPPDPVLFVVGSANLSRVRFPSRAGSGGC